MDHKAGAKSDVHHRNIGRYCAYHRDSTQYHANHRICGLGALPPRNDHKIHVGPQVQDSVAGEPHDWCSKVLRTTRLVLSGIQTIGIVASGESGPKSGCSAVQRTQLMQPMQQKQ